MSKEELLDKLNVYLNDRQLAVQTKNGDADGFSVQKSLDSSLKKNTAFMKRCRTSLTADNYDLFIKEIKSLSLEKFVPEIILSITEGLSKCRSVKDIQAAVRIVFFLYQRFSVSFIRPLLANLYSMLYPSPADSISGNLSRSSSAVTVSESISNKGTSVNIAKTRALLRIFVEFWLHGLVHVPDDFKDFLPAVYASGKKFRKGLFEEKSLQTPLVVILVEDVLAAPSNFSLLPIVSSLVKSYKYELFSSDEALPGESEINKCINRVCDSHWRLQLRTSLGRYYQDLIGYIESRQHEFEEYRDQLSERDFLENTLEGTSNKAEDFLKSIEGDIANEMQDSFYKKREEVMSIQNNILNAEILVQTGAVQLWDSEEEHQFYETFPELPNLELAEKKSFETSGDQEVKAEASVEDSQKHTKPSKSVSVKIDNLLQALPNFMSAEQVDQAALEFLFLNTKASRNRVIKAFCNIPRTSSFLVPYYIRFARIMTPVAPDIASALVEHARGAFRRMMNRKAKHEYDTRTLIVRYISELTKFRLMSFSHVFECYKMCLLDFTSFDLEVLSLLLENCGRFLYRFPKSSLQISSFLEVVQKKKLAAALPSQEQLILDNALYFVNPPKTSSEKVRKRPLKEEFLRFILHIRLSETNLSATIALLRKFDWKADFEILYSTFMEVWNMKYECLNSFASLIASLYKTHPDFCIYVIDDTVDSLLTSIDSGSFGDSQKRLAQAKFLAELYCVRLLDVRSIIGILFYLLPPDKFQSILQFSPTAATNKENELFRLRMIALLLSTCGSSLVRSKTRKTMLTYLLAYQCYFLAQPEVPLDMQFEFDDVVPKVRPSMKVHKRFDEAWTALSERIQSGVDDHDQDDEDGGSILQSEKSNESENGHEANDWDDNEENEDSSDDSESEEEISMDMDDPELFNSEEELDEEHIHTMEIDEELSRMMNDSLSSRAHERGIAFDVPLPLRSTSGDTSFSDLNNLSTENEENVKFTLLTKKGNKQRSQVLDVPYHSVLAQSTKSRQEEELIERKRMKEMVLNYD
ncbi:uncharacterized protein SOCG_04221 [Schizosaccharomyces octosporus yFS286]|uniref:MIF4G domain-containing protein n=1 Tax=Schizosaccharomyces octosporus (strain yFS286) TaxID=483514 RepID=S9PNB1_SCHOY|nr:uncharacterized protein SOCG_04221 [Schizosaccharomyces octosporus yFS286]EPX70736.1 hypothetical protein SOCG_04221 [Schizosaccharomyces octosporus yFS286]